MANWLVWLPMLPAVLAPVAAAFNGWSPWQIVALVAACAPAAAAIACALAWYLIRARALDDALQSDEQIARALGAALSAALVDARAAAEVWAAHATLPADRRREMALGVIGHLRASEVHYAPGETVQAVVRGFVPKPDAPQIGSPQSDTPEARAHSFGFVVGQCSAYAKAATLNALWTAFGELPAQRQGELVAALSGFTSAADLDEFHNLDAQLLSAIDAFRAPVFEPASAE